MSDKKQPLLDEEALPEKNPKKNKARRRVLKKAGVATSVVAASAWVKPSLNSVILPAHAQTSMPATTVMMGGGTSVSPIASSGKNHFNNIANKALNAVIPEAHAGIDFSGGICRGFTVNGADDNTHCVSLQLDQAADNASFTLSLSGPPIYYNFCGISYAEPYYAYYEGVRLFGSDGPATGMLDGKDLFVEMGDLTFQGTVDDSFESASGNLFINNLSTSISIGSFNEGNEATCGAGYGAYWETSTAGAACVIGTGISSSNNRPRVNPVLCAD